MHDEQRQRTGSDAEEKQIGSDEEQTDPAREDLALDAERSEQVKGGNPGEPEGSAGSQDGDW